jgi:signal transduction histidine kinase
MYNYINSISACWDFLKEGSVLSLVYYSHIPVIVLGLFFSVFIYLKKKKDLLSNIFLIFNLVFVFWVINDLFVWIMAHDSSVTMFAWSTLELIEASFFFVCLNFVYIFLFNKKIPAIYNFLLVIPVFFIFILTIFDPFIYSYDVFNCEAIENVGNILYVWITDIFYIVAMFTLFIYKLFLNKKDKIKDIIFFTGLICFLLLYLFTLYIADYLGDYNIGLIALAGMPVFLAVVGFLAVRFGVFNFKILGAQILVFLSIFMVGSQFTFIQNPINRILNSVTLFVLFIGGILLIKSIKKVDQQKELLDIANREQENLIHFISHQIKGFFTKSRNIFSTINDEKDSIPTDLHSFIDEGIRSDNEGIKVVTDILNAANLKTGKVQFNKEKFYLNLLVESIIDHNKTLADKKGIALKYNSPGKIIEFHGDEARLKDAIGNIINNSVHYTMAGGVKIDLIQEPKQIKIVVTDTGVGLTETDKAKLFNSGGRGTDSLKYNVNSTGYGLYIAKRVIEGHGGAITAESDGRDKGSTFTIILPN